MIRTSQTEDAAAIAEGRSTDFVTRYNLYRKAGRDEVCRELEASEENCREYISLFDRQSGELIGAVVLSEDSHRYHVDSVSIEAWLTEKNSRRGYMTEALRAILRELFVARSHDRVSCEIMAENIASLRMVESLGFTREGVLRSSVRTYDDRVHDSVLFSMEREEYFERYGG
jgi:ribosomal-protein-alanine N-acetyltransferase